MKPLMARATSQQLGRALRRMGIDYDFDPYLPTKQRYAKAPKAIETPGVPYPPGYYTNLAVASLRFDRWIEGLGRKEKIVPGQKNIFHGA